MLRYMSSTPRVITVNRGTRAGIVHSLILEQAQLLSAALGPRKMIGGQLRAALVEPELFTGDLEAASDHPGHRACALHARTPLRIVVAAAAHVADQGEDMAIAVRIIRHQPLAKEIAHFERQAKQHIACLPGA